MFYNNTKITLIVSGSIAAYKSGELCRELVKQGADVQVVLSKSAAEFVTPLTLQTLSGKAVYSDMFDRIAEAEIGHIQIADSSDLIIIAPATADIIARASIGLAGDLATTILLATKAPVLVAPAMNVNMWNNVATQGHVRTLKERGWHFVGPESGELACGWQGEGRLSSSTRIVEATKYVLSPKDLVGSHVVVAAGNTEEPLDDSSYVSSYGSELIGHTLATVAHRRGASVSLVTTRHDGNLPQEINRHVVKSSREMLATARTLVSTPSPAITSARTNQFFFMMAHIPNVAPQDKLSTTIQASSPTLLIPCSPSPDLLTELSLEREQIQTSSGAMLKLIGLVKKSGVVEELVSEAKDKMRRKNADLLIGDFFGGTDSLEEGSPVRLWIVDKSGREEEISSSELSLVVSKIITAAIRA